MGVTIRQVTADWLPRYRQVPMWLVVCSCLEVEELDGGLGGLRLKEIPLDEPYVKDYESQETGGRGAWESYFDVSRWGFWLAFSGETPVGGAAVAFRSPGMLMFEHRDDLAVLWDLRVHPDWQRQGVGQGLFGKAAGWARRQGCRQLKIETQSVNVPACRFYARQGCRLGSIIRHIYPPPLDHEAMLLWYLDL